MTDKENNVLAEVERRARPILDSKQKHFCPHTTYSTDRPGANFLNRLSPNYGDKFRYLRKTLHDKIYGINHKLYISSPYILNNRKTRRLMKSLLDKNVDITMYTNSLASTDAIYIAANLYKDIFRWARQGMNTYVHPGKYAEENEIMPEEVTKAQWGTHSKTQIYESINSEGELISEVMVGTYNVDNRSNFYNSEMAIFCKGSDSFSKEIKDNLMLRIDNSYLVHGNRTATDKNGDKVSVFGKNAKNKKLMWAIALPSWLLKFLL